MYLYHLPRWGLPCLSISHCLEIELLAAISLGSSATSGTTSSLLRVPSVSRSRKFLSFALCGDIQVNLPLWTRRPFRCIFRPLLGSHLASFWQRSSESQPCGHRCSNKAPWTLQSREGSACPHMHCPHAAGDQVDHLMYRLQHRELLKRHPPKVSVLLIGTNDLGAASCFPGGGAPITRAANATAQRCGTCSSSY